MTLFCSPFNIGYSRCNKSVKVIILPTVNATLSFFITIFNIITSLLLVICTNNTHTTHYVL